MNNVATKPAIRITSDEEERQKQGYDVITSYEFSKENGIPSKCGVSGGLLSVIPGTGAVASMAPRLDQEGNSVKGIGMI